MELDELIASRDIPGICVGTFSDGEENYVTAGVRSAEDPVPVTADTLFRVASITKTVTACALMRLVADGKVDLDASVRTYLPDFRVADAAASAQVTVRDLATHRGGWEEHPLLRLPATEQDDGALARGIAALSGAAQIFPLRRYYSYNNSGFAALGRIIEVVSGRPYEDAARAFVTEPMGLGRTFFFTNDAITYPVALGHTGSPPRVVRPWWRSRARAPQGGMLSTARDLITYARRLLDSDVLPADAMREMWRPHAAADGFADFVGVGWHIDEPPGGPAVVGHEGLTAGFGCKLAIVPERDAAYVVLINSDSAQDVVRTVLRDLLGAPQPEPPAPVPPPDRTPYVGTYTDGLDTPRVRADGIIEVPGELSEPLRFTGADAATAGEALVRFLRDDAGAVGWLRIDGSVYRRVG
jgi:CubicO group peptidase (beta-lactamase class C family)